jgi:hypothetical protein
VIVFAAAHLHSTVPNSSDKTRFSLDFRTVDARDLADDRGAPNIDSECKGTTLMDYLRMRDLAHFADEEIERQMQLTRSPVYSTPQELVAQSV